MQEARARPVQEGQRRTANGLRRWRGVSQKPKRSIDLGSLLLGLVFGFGTNLVTASPERWWRPFRPVDKYAPIWLSASVVATAAWVIGQRLRVRRQHPWVSPENPYPGLESF